MIGKLLRRFRRRGAVSETWLAAYDLQATKGGVDLPRWRFPKEREAMRKPRTFAEWQQRHARRAS